jgi:hypothetical protein
MWLKDDTFALEPSSPSRPKRAMSDRMKNRKTKKREPTNNWGEQILKCVYFVISRY